MPLQRFEKYSEKRRGGGGGKVYASVRVTEGAFSETLKLWARPYF